MVRRTEIRFEGVGGQGIVLAAVVLAEALGIHEGLEVAQTSIYDPETRGGAVRSEVVAGSDPINHPEAVRPNVMVALSQKAANNSTDLAEDGVLIVDPLFVASVPGIKGKVYRVPVTQIADQVGRRLTANIVMLGAVAKVAPMVSMASLEKAVAARAPKGTTELNLKALRAGYEAADNDRVHSRVEGHDGYGLRCCRSG